MNKTQKYLLPGIILFIAASFLCAVIAVNWSPGELFITPDQRGRILMEKRDFAGAAKVFHDSMQRGTALYRNGDFKEAAAAFAQSGSTKALYNRANALLMQGKYDKAIAGYEQVLTLKPEWLAARENLNLAQARKAKMTPDEDDTGGTGGKLKADEIVFDQRAKTAAEDQQEQIAGGDKLSDQVMRAMWLRRIETKPADFLRAKFAYQKAFNHVNKNPKKSPEND